MTDIDITESLKRKAKERAAVPLKPAPAEVSDEKSPLDGRNIVIILGVIIGLFALFFLGFRMYNSLSSAAVLDIDDLHQQNLQGKLTGQEGYVYNGYSFVNADGLWWTEMNKFGTKLKVPLHFGPKDLENITISGSLDPSFNDGDEVYVAIDPNITDRYYTLAISELSFNLVKGMDRAPIGSCTIENWACENRTIVNCEHTQGKPVIELAYGGEDKIELKGSCIKLQGTQYGITKAVDRILYQWYGIMAS